MSSSGRQSAGPALNVGDPVPRFVLPDRRGGKVDFGHQNRAGQIMIFAVARPQDATEMVAASASWPVAGEVAVFCTVIGSQPGDPALSDDMMLPDPSGVMAKAFAVSPPAWVALDAGARVALKLPHGPDAVGAVGEAVATLRAHAPATTVRGQAPVLVVPGLFEPSFCERLMDHWSRGRKVTDLTSASGGESAGSRADAVLKRRADVPVDDKALTLEIRRRITRRALPLIAASYQRKVDYFETFRIGCYDAENSGHFGRHRDNTTPYTAHRLFALTANLNGTYAGGEVVFPEFGQTRYRPDPGNGLIFSCALLHQALPVTEGRRFGLFGFLFDRAGAEHVERMMAQEKAAGRDPEAAWR